MNHKQPLSMARTAAETLNRRAQNEPKLHDGDLIANFPGLESSPEGLPRAKAAVKKIVNDFFNDSEIQKALKDKTARYVSLHDGVSPQGHLILAPLSFDAEKSTHDGRYFFEAYVGGKTDHIEEVKDTLFAIRREAKRAENADNRKMQKMHDLASIAIFNIQRQREIDLPSSR